MSVGCVKCKCPSLCMSVANYCEDFFMVFGIPFRIQKGQEERVNLPL